MSLSGNSGQSSAINGMGGSSMGGVEEYDEEGMRRPDQVKRQQLIGGHPGHYPSQGRDPYAMPHYSEGGGGGGTARSASTAFAFAFASGDGAKHSDSNKAKQDVAQTDIAPYSRRPRGDKNKQTELTSFFDLPDKFTTTSGVRTSSSQRGSASPTTSASSSKTKRMTRMRVGWSHSWTLSTLATRARSCCRCGRR
jgi:hypothetical protein